MIFDTKPLDDIEESVLQALLVNPVPERKRIEYKSELPTDKFKDRKEFLADVSSFANTVGGYLLYGVKEEDGMPVEICGVEVGSVDALKSKKVKNRVQEKAPLCIFPWKGFFPKGKYLQ